MKLIWKFFSDSVVLLLKCCVSVRVSVVIVMLSVEVIWVEMVDSVVVLLWVLVGMLVKVIVFSVVKCMECVMLVSISSM